MIILNELPIIKQLFFFFGGGGELRFEVLTAVGIKITVFWNVAPCS
jgi:hypothetical protein